MFDRDTLIITYDVDRGEPRGGRRKGTDPRAAGLGDCTDCTMCVQVCPTGIDIRNGLQYECIACAACIDACDSVMDKMGYARGLVRYDPQPAVDHKQTQVLRPRVIVYGVLLLALCIGFIVALAMRQPISLDVLHDRNTLYRTLETGEIENVYLLKLINKDSVPRRLIVSVQSEHDNADRYRLDPAIPAFTVPAGEVFNAAVRVRKNAWDDSAEASERHEEHERDEAGVSEVRFEVRAENDPSLRASAEARFFAPRR